MEKPKNVEESIKRLREQGGLARRKGETTKEHIARINRFRCGY